MPELARQCRAGQGRAGQCKDRLEAAGQNTEKADPADWLGWTGQHSIVMTELRSQITNTGLAFTIHIRHHLGIYQNKDLDFYIGGNFIVQIEGTILRKVQIKFLFR